MEGFPVALGIMMDIDKARRLTRGHKPTHRVNVKAACKLIKQDEVRVKKSHWKRGKLKDEPVIMMVIAGIKVVIDGWHRIRRAKYDGKTYLPAYILTDSEARACSMPIEWFKNERRKK